MPILDDSNVLLDVLTEDRRWAAWSADALAERDVLTINPIIYAEVPVAFIHAEQSDQNLGALAPWRLCVEFYSSD